MCVYQICYVNLMSVHARDRNRPGEFSQKKNFSSDR